MFATNSTCCRAAARRAERSRRARPGKTRVSSSSEAVVFRVRADPQGAPRGSHARKTFRKCIVWLVQRGARFARLPERRETGPDHSARRPPAAMTAAWQSGGPVLRSTAMAHGGREYPLCAWVCRHACAWITGLGRSGGAAAPRCVRPTDHRAALGWCVIQLNMFVAGRPPLSRVAETFRKLG